MGGLFEKRIERVFVFLYSRTDIDICAATTCVISLKTGVLSSAFNVHAKMG